LPPLVASERVDKPAARLDLFGRAGYSAGWARVDTTETNPLVEVAFSTLLLVGIIIFHGATMRGITRRFNAAWVRVTAVTPRWRVSFLLSSAIAAMAATHLVETFLWALPLFGLGMLSSLRDCYFFVLESYTTLGGGNISLPDQWRLVGPMIGMSGIFTFGWTGSVLVTIMNEIGKLDRTQAAKDQRGKAAPRGRERD
jgi:hypothetical protein